MRKYHLLAPGPTPVPPEVLEAMARPLMHHRTKDFEALFEEVRAGLSWLYQDEGDVITLAASGSGGMEATVANLLSPGDKALIVEGGKFGERWVEICAAYGIETDVLSVEWGRSVNVDEIEARLKAGGHQALFVQASETSTGSKHDVQKIAETVRRVSPDTLIGVDAITALGVYDIQPAGWDIDAVITGSQKALMLPPGLAFVWLSERAWAAAEVSKSPRYYFDLRIERKSQAKNTTAWTPAISLVAGLKVAFDMMQKEGLENIFGRHARLAEGTRAAFLALGLEIFPKDLLSESVSAVSVPEGIDGKAVPNLMQGEQGITIAGGQGHLSGKIFRIGHMGYVDESDVLTAIGGLEMVLAGLGHRLTKGAGLAAAQEVFSK
ncbi:MAG: alanine--glyoxylate aminotransferase family protein [Nitrospinaceae bacterium]|jgi:aspartate aminotransferase-like enzyme|nr:alanine--glyoxylate aminotransferase family protein [Nitrospinaceae bacterium]MBT3434116.1 alanine--glyoxylate aminotransferase family protein [Nitrospinaceae bacterium]MBT3820533.1 alanine--glyoxylate aminotransferase family protein [Nitrospinaceae bacterium]MBT4093470.1 alanine--glyoxylate aminotransferase family protein [Nitrospinaceae bacterium]MBT6395944.1 alanine--glyoxylate aminotransferase family protein [Nitrospinaceae bacterium]